MRITKPIIVLALLCLPGVAVAGVGEAVEKVRQGVNHYKQGDYKTAGKAFAEADVALPDDPRIAFDRACALSAAGDADKAIELFQQAALSPDQNLSAQCYYNLGCISAAKARELFGEHPEQATPEVRTEGIDILRRAVGRYRDCLKAKPDHAEARHNLEMIRLWIKHMQALWQERDREEQRKEKGLLEFLLMLEKKQRDLRTTGKSLAELPDSPRRRQAFTATESAQRLLQEEIKPLKEKIGAEFKPPSQPSGAASPGQLQAAAPSSDKAQAMELLNRLADEAGDSMTSAADLLGEGSQEPAARAQAEAVEKLDQIYMAVAPFANLVQRGVKTQEGLVDESTGVVESMKESSPADESARPDFDEMAWNQQFVAGWSRIMGPKAKQGLAATKLDVASLGAQQPGATQPPPAGQAKQQKEAEAVRKSMEKAVELSEKVHELTTQAAEDLKKAQPVEALPKQEEALKLLKEIAEQLPKQEQKQDQKNQDKENKNQEKKDQEKKEDQGKQDQQKKDQQKDQGKQDQKKQQQQKQPKPKDLSKKQAEAVLRKARQRQREHENEKKKLQRLLYQPGKVEKDW